MAKNKIGSTLTNQKTTFVSKLKWNDDKVLEKNWLYILHLKSRFSVYIVIQSQNLKNTYIIPLFLLKIDKWCWLRGLAG